MDIEGGGRLHVFAPEDEKPHAPGPQENWQESFVIIWYDATQSIGGFFRLGHEPNYEGGKSQIFSNIFSPEGIYHRFCHLPLRPRDRFETGCSSGDDTLRYEVVDGRMRWRLKDTDVEMNIEVDDFVPPIDGHRREGQQNIESYMGAHVDASCSVSGTLTVKGKTYRIERALAARDHGWGPRAWHSLQSHRWTVATFDRENSFVAISFLTIGKELVKFGWVIRGGKVIFARDVDIKAIIGMDGASNYGGTTTMKLSTGEVLDAKFEPYYPCFASQIHQTVNFDTMCRVTWGKSVGFGVFESTCNIQHGTLLPTIYDDSTIAEAGWHTGISPLI